MSLLVDFGGLQTKTELENQRKLLIEKNEA
jgi:hypothetical protein